MPLYEFECQRCRYRFTRVMHVVEYKEPPCPSCMDRTEQVYDHGNYGIKLGMTPGKRSGFYEYDYGKKATWDLTVPGKIDELRKAGVIPPDPFDKVPKWSDPHALD